MALGKLRITLNFNVVAFGFLTPFSFACYLAFLPQQTTQAAEQSLLQSLFFALAFTMPSWWSAWAVSSLLHKIAERHVPLLLIAIIGYCVSLILFQPYYQWVYGLIKMMQPLASEIVQRRAYGISFASLVQFSTVNFPGLFMWCLIIAAFDKLLRFNPLRIVAKAPSEQGGSPVIETAGQEDLPAFAERTGIRSASDILLIEAQEHYLRIVTPSRAVLIRCRMRDAVSQIPAQFGLQVHRSWWVAERMVKDCTPIGRTLELTLNDGQRVPVSLGYREAVKQRLLGSRNSSRLPVMIAR